MLEFIGDFLILNIKILPEYGQEDQLKLHELLLLTILNLNLIARMQILLPNNANILHGQHQAQHNQISIRSIQTMRIIGSKLRLIGANPLHDFMFALARAIATGKNDGDVFPIVVLGDFLLDEEGDHQV